jgi:hypothetical protein
VRRPIATVAVDISLRVNCSLVRRAVLDRRTCVALEQLAGSATGVSINGRPGIDSPVHCHFLNQAPAPSPASGLSCVVTKSLGCFNDTTATQQQELLPTYVESLHDHVTLEGCAAACSAGAGGRDAAAAIRDGNHCYCGLEKALSTPEARNLRRPLDECIVPAAECPCASKKTRGCNCRCSGNFSQSCGDTDRLLAFSFKCKLLG